MTQDALHGFSLAISCLPIAHMILRLYDSRVVPGKNGIILCAGSLMPPSIGNFSNK